MSKRAHLDLRGSCPTYKLSNPLIGSNPACQVLKNSNTVGTTPSPFPLLPALPPSPSRCRLHTHPTPTVMPITSPMVPTVSMVQLRRRLLLRPTRYSPASSTAIASSKPTSGSLSHCQWIIELIAILDTESLSLLTETTFPSLRSPLSHVTTRPSSSMSPQASASA